MDARTAVSTGSMIGGFGGGARDKAADAGVVFVGGSGGVGDDIKHLVAESGGVEGLIVVLQSSSSSSLRSTLVDGTETSTSLARRNPPMLSCTLSVLQNSPFPSLPSHSLKYDDEDTTNASR